MDSGIYVIKNNLTGHKYVGQAVNLRKRWRRHLSSLKNKKHFNTYLQNHFYKYGENNFSFNVLEWCEIDLLDTQEEYWIKKLQTMNRKMGYNRESGGNKGKYVSMATKHKKMGVNNPMYGKKLSKEHLQKITEANQGSSDLLNSEKVEEIKLRYLSGETQTELAAEYGVVVATINKITRCKNWSWVRPDLEKDLIDYALEEKQGKRVKILNAAKQSQNVSEIAKATGINIGLVRRVLKENEISFSIDLAERNKKIVSDFNKGMCKAEIMQKHKISSAVYVKVTSEAFNKRRQGMIKQAQKRYSEGITQKEVAKELGIHECTVREYLRK